MAQEDGRRALLAMDADEVVRLRLAEGDFGAVDGLALSPDEQLLVQDAANDMPEVAGFGLSFLKLGDIKGESSDDKHKGQIEIQSWSLGAQNLKWQTAVKYGFK